MARLKVHYGPYEYWCLVGRAPSTEERDALAETVVQRLTDAAPLAPGGYVQIILDAMAEAKRQIDAGEVAAHA